MLQWPFGAVYPFRAPTATCYNGPVITYSRQEMERQLVADKRLWRRVPNAATAVLWPLEIALLGWSSGWWLGLATLLFLCAASSLLPSRLKVSIYLMDLLERFVRLPMGFAWLLLLWHLWQREPLFPVLGQPLLGAIGITALLAGTTQLVPVLIRLTSTLLPQRS